MFADYVYEKSGAAYSNRILLIDADDLLASTKYTESFSAHGFDIIIYKDDLSFRIESMDQVLSPDRKTAVVARPDQYIPYDLRRRIRIFNVSLAALFPRLDTTVLREQSSITYDLLSSAYPQSFENLTNAADTLRFLQQNVYSRDNIQTNLHDSCRELISRAEGCVQYKEWFTIAEEKARIDVMAVEHDVNVDTSRINYLFRDYIMAQYGKLSTAMDSESPVLVSKAMEFMRDHSSRFIIIVMDGMAEFDWNILSASFADIQYHKASAFAMIPTVTSVSRQCLLSDKYPRELINPWGQSKEKQEFVECAKRLGFADRNISYQRGYDSDFDHSVRCGAVIINDIDDMVHGQMQGRIGMFNDVSVMAKQKKLAEMTKHFLAAGFDVYITADHGNTTRHGMGKLTGTGVEMETKSRCMLVLKDFADKDGIKEKYGLIEFPKTYLPKEFDYLICNIGDSFDAKGDDVMSHGGISIDECVVPFIKIKAVENNG